MAINPVVPRNSIEQNAIKTAVSNPVMQTFNPKSQEKSVAPQIVQDAQKAQSKQDSKKAEAESYTETTKDNYNSSVAQKNAAAEATRAESSKALSNADRALVESQKALAEAEAKAAEAKVSTFAEASSVTKPTIDHVARAEANAQAKIDAAKANASSSSSSSSKTSSNSLKTVDKPITKEETAKKQEETKTENKEEAAVKAIDNNINPSPNGSIGSEIGNTLAQTGRVFGGIAQGALKAVATPGMMLEAAVQSDANRYATAQETFTEMRQEAPYLTQDELINAKANGEINQAQYDATIDSWKQNGSPISDTVQKEILTTEQTTPIKTPITDTAREWNQKIQNVTDSIIPSPSNPASEFVAKGSDALGEAVPAMGVSLVTGGTALGGSLASYAMSFGTGFGGEMLEGSGDLNKALFSGGLEAATEFIGGKTIGKVAEAIPNKALSKIADAGGEGLEEVFSGAINSLVTGEDYNLSDIAMDFGLGTFVGGAVGVTTGVGNAVKSEIGTAKTVSDIKSGKSGDYGALTGLNKSVEIAKANPNKYGDIGKILSIPSETSVFNTGAFRNYVEGATGEAERNDIKVPSNIENTSAQNIGQYNTLSESGMRNAASVLEAAQVGKGLSPRQSGKILNAVLDTNTKLYNQLGKVGEGGITTDNTVQIEKGADYSKGLPQSGINDNFAVVATPGAKASAEATDTGINVFRGMSSEWVIPTLDAGKFAVPNATPSNVSENGENTTLFGSSPGQMLGAGLYLTSIPSKADQYSSGKANDISLIGRDSGGIMEYSPFIGGQTFVNSEALSQAESGMNNDTVMRGASGNETALKDFINSNQGNSEAAAIYSKQGTDYTEIVRPDNTKTQIESLYVPLEAAESITAGRTTSDVSTNSNSAVEATSEVKTNVDSNAQSQLNTEAYEAGQRQANTASEDVTARLGNDDVNSVLDLNIAPDVKVETVGNSGVEKESEISEKQPNESPIPYEVKSEFETVESNVNASIESLDANTSTIAENNGVKETNKSLLQNEIKQESAAIESTSNTLTETSASSGSIPSNEINTANSMNSPVMANSINSEISNSSGVTIPSSSVNNPISSNNATTNKSDNTNTSPSTFVSDTSKSEAVDTPVSTNLTDTKSSEAETVEGVSVESGGEAEERHPTPEERGREIWTPLSIAQQNTPTELKRDKKKNGGGDVGLDIGIGQGATGQIYETSSYNTTFSGLSSY